jgi:hypothetical protein
MGTIRTHQFPPTDRSHLSSRERPFEGPQPTADAGGFLGVMSVTTKCMAPNRLGELTSWLRSRNPMVDRRPAAVPMARSGFGREEERPGGHLRGARAWRAVLLPVGLCLYHEGVEGSLIPGRCGQGGTPHEPGGTCRASGFVDPRAVGH